jgi:hypothetical protein
MADTTLLPGQVEFIQHRLPKLESGNYNLVVTHRLGTAAEHETFTTDLLFSVGGERFAIDPTEVDSVFPPSGAVGEFFNVLPHLVLRRPMLPWIRSPLDEPIAPEGHDDVPSWLALLVFDEQDPQPRMTSGKVSDLMSKDRLASYLKPSSTDPAVPQQMEFEETADDPCLLLDVDYGLFQRIAPSLADLNWLATVRAVTGQRPGADPDAQPDAEYAIITAGRLPKPGRRSTVHLVSLEEMADYLPGGAAGAGEIDTVRLVSLYRWSFDTIPEPETFGEVVEAVGLGKGLVVEPADADLSDPLAKTALALGYVPLDHRLRDGGRTVSWYRGPLAPTPMAPTLAELCPLGSADAAIRFDPASGMLDMSYAAAWQLGRMMALADLRFSAQLFEWKHHHARGLVEAAEHDLLLQRLTPEGDPDGAAADQAAGDQADPPGRSERAAALHAAFASVAYKAAAILSPAAAIAPPGPRPVAQGSVDPAALPAEAGRWLDRLRHLHGVPFRYLVPMENMLKTETIRFFHLDPNWMAAAVDGAFSLGDVATGNAAPTSFKDGAPAAPVKTNPVSGFLMRSRAVKHWPGLLAEAWDASGAPLTLLRYEKLAEDTLLCLVDGALAKLQLHQPPEAMHFGFDGSYPFHKILRDPDSGAHLPDEPGVDLVWQAQRDAVDIAGLAAAAKEKLGCDIFTSAEFALIMVVGVDQVTFSGGPAPDDTMRLIDPNEQQVAFS